MVKLIFFWGDFKVDHIQRLTLGNALMSVLDSFPYNVVNFEAPVLKGNRQPIVKSGLNISQDSSTPQYLESKGFNVISLANNHAMDYGEDGFNDTCKAFHEALLIGAGNWKDAYKVLLSRQAFLLVSFFKTMEKWGKSMDLTIYPNYKITRK